MFLFGGIQDLTKEKNDLFYYDFPTKKWHMVFESVQGVEVDKFERQEQVDDKSPEKMEEVEKEPL